MTTLKIEPTTLYVVWSGDLVNFIREHYGRSVSITLGRELHNHSYIEIEVGPHMDLDDMEMDDAKIAIDTWLHAEAPADKRDGGWQEALWHERENYIAIELILWDLHLKGLIPAGDYLFKVFW